MKQSVPARLFASSLSVMAGLIPSFAQAGLDEAAFSEARPRSILVMPPGVKIVGSTLSTDQKIPSAIMAQMTFPLAEGGYYVIPIMSELETFRGRNIQPHEDIIRQSPQKLYGVFGADAALYSNIEVDSALVKIWRSYGISGDFPAYETYRTARVTETLVDLKTGHQLWDKTSLVSASDMNSDKSFWGEMNVSLNVLSDIATFTMPDETYKAAGVLMEKALAIGQKDGLPYGPRSPHYRSPHSAAK